MLCFSSADRMDVFCSVNIGFIHWYDWLPAGFLSYSCIKDLQVPSYLTDHMRQICVKCFHKFTLHKEENSLKKK